MSQDDQTSVMDIDDLGNIDDFEGLDDLEDATNDDQAEISRTNFPIISSLFKLKFKDASKRSKDATCKGCNHQFKGVKPSVLYKYSKKCSSSDTTLAKVFQESYEEYRQRRLDKIARKHEISPTSTTRLIEFIAVQSVPLSIVNSREFKLFLNSINSDYTVPEKKQIAK